jgi:hypothetical protein
MRSIDAFGPLAQPLELIAGPADQESIDAMQSRGQFRLVEMTVVVVLVGLRRSLAVEVPRAQSLCVPPWQLQGRGLLRSRRMRIQLIRRQFELARANLAFGQRAYHRVVAPVSQLLWRRLQGGVSGRIGANSCIWAKSLLR